MAVKADSCVSLSCRETEEDVRRSSNQEVADGGSVEFSLTCGLFVVVTVTGGSLGDGVTSALRGEVIGTRRLAMRTCRCCPGVIGDRDLARYLKKINPPTLTSVPTKQMATMTERAARILFSIRSS